MGISLLLRGVAVLLAGGVLALATSRSPRLSSLIGSAAAVIGSLLALFAPLGVLRGGATVSLRLPWHVPYGSFSIEIDPLSAWFLVPILGISALAAVYGRSYLSGQEGKRALGAHWFFFNLLVAAMALVVTARNGILFLVAWETMALSSYFLVVFESDQETVREAGWTYLVATHIGTAFLLAMFALLGGAGPTLDFEALAAVPRTAKAAGAVFLLAVVGFGAKAGFVPFHVWLPEAHPAAPSHVSALMSAVMIKTGLYGIVRTLTFLGTPPAWWGWVLIGVGLVAGLTGIVFALGQRDVKRMLAYSSVENVGIIALGLGVGVLGRSVGSATLATLGMAGALLHVLNHAMMKGVLFLGAGVVLHATGTREMDRLGGLSRTLPMTGLAFLVGAVAISGLPPLNGFAGEFLVFLGAFHGAAAGPAATSIPSVALIAGLALIGGLAAACFTRAYGVIFLGAARAPEAEHAHAPGLGMKAPLVVLASGCVAVGLCAPDVVRVAGPAIARAAGLSGDAAAVSVLTDAMVPLGGVLTGATLFLALALALAGLRRLLLARRSVGAGLTWDCGYARPAARMQYTSSSFSQPLTALFQGVLRTRTALSAPQGAFPDPGALATTTPDACRELGYAPLFRGIALALSKLRWLQHGNLHLYVLYLVLTLLALLLWKLG